MSQPNGLYPFTGKVWLKAQEEFFKILGLIVSAFGGIFVADAITTAALAANTYANGTAGVGATLTGNANGALAAQDGYTLSVAQLLLVANEATAANNGLYVITQLGSASTPYILTRVAWWNAAALILTGANFYLRHGTVNATKVWKYTGPSSPTLGTTNLTFATTAAAGGGSLPANIVGVVEDVASLAGATPILSAAPPASGLYRVTAAAEAHTNTDAAVVITLNYTDAVEGASETITMGTFNLVHDSATGSQSATQLIRASAAANIVVASTGSGQTTTKFSAVIERLA